MDYLTELFEVFPKNIANINEDCEYVRTIQTNYSDETYRLQWIMKNSISSFSAEAIDRKMGLFLFNMNETTGFLSYVRNEVKRPKKEIISYIQSFLKKHNQTKMIKLIENSNGDNWIPSDEKAEKIYELMEKIDAREFIDLIHSLFWQSYYICSYVKFDFEKGEIIFHNKRKKYIVREDNIDEFVKMKNEKILNCKKIENIILTVAEQMELKKGRNSYYQIGKSKFGIWVDFDLFSNKYRVQINKEHERESIKVSSEDLEEMLEETKIVLERAFKKEKLLNLF